MFFHFEGYFYTSNVHAYIKRLFIFAIISYIPYALCFSGNFIPIYLVKGSVVPTTTIIPYGPISITYPLFLNFINSTLVVCENSMFFTLFLGLISIFLWDKINIPVWAKFLITLVLMYLASFSDYSYFGVLFYLAFYFLRNKPWFQFISFSIISLLYIFHVSPDNPFIFSWSIEFMPVRIGVFLTPLLLLFFNGESGSKSSFNKWFFYIFYPAHLLLIGLVATFIGAYV